MSSVLWSVYLVGKLTSPTLFVGNTFTVDTLATNELDIIDQTVQSKQTTMIQNAGLKGSCETVDHNDDV